MTIPLKKKTTPQKNSAACVKNVNDKPLTKVNPSTMQ